MLWSRGASAAAAAARRTLPLSTAALSAATRAPRPVPCAATLSTVSGGDGGGARDGDGSAGGEAITDVAAAAGAAARPRGFASRVHNLLSPNGMLRRASSQGGAGGAVGGEAASSPKPSRRYVPFHPKRIARRLQRDPRFAGERGEQLLQLFRLHRVALRLRWMRHTDVLRLLAHNLGGINPNQVALGGKVSSPPRSPAASTHALAAGQQQRSAAAAEEEDLAHIPPDDDNVAIEYDVVKGATTGSGNGGGSRGRGGGGGGSDAPPPPPPEESGMMMQQHLPEFLDSLHLLADKANYDLLSEDFMERSLFAPTPTRGGITVVPLNREDYSTVLVWVRGRHMGACMTAADDPAPGTLARRARDAVETTLGPVIHGRQGGDQGAGASDDGDGGGGGLLLGASGRRALERFSSVFVAVRMRRAKDPHEALHLMLFKDVPTTQLHLLLPDVGVTMGAADRARVLFMGGIGGLTVAAKTAAVAYCAAAAKLQAHATAKGSAAAVELSSKAAAVASSDTVQAGLFLALAIAGGVAFQTVAHFHATKAKFAAALQRNLHEKNVAHNEVVINTLVEETELQELKETMLAYAVMCRGGGEEEGKEGASADSFAAAPWLSPAQVKEQAEAWLVAQFGAAAAGDVRFDAHDALDKLVAGRLAEAAPARGRGGGGMLYRAADVGVAMERMRAQAHAEVELGGRMLPSDAHVLDLGITCPATPAHVNGAKRTHKTHGAAAEAYDKVKQDRYDRAGMPNAVPFIVETRGRFSEGARRFVDEVHIDRAQPGDLLVAHKLFRQICWNLLDHNAYCRSKLTQELAIPDVAAAPAG